MTSPQPSPPETPWATAPEYRPRHDMGPGRIPAMWIVVALANHRIIEEAAAREAQWWTDRWERAAPGPQ